MNQELTNYIRQQMNINVSKNKITDVLLEQGWHQSEIDEAFAAADGVSRAAREDIFSDGNDDGGKPAGGGFSGGKMILLGFSALAILAVAAGVFIFPQMGGKKEAINVALPATENKEGGGEPAAPSEKTENNPNPENGEKKEITEKIEAMIAEEAKKLEGTIQPPAGWTPQSGILKNRPMAVFYKEASGDKVSENELISVVRDIYKSVNISNEADYMASAKKQLKEIEGNYKIDSESKKTLSDGSGAVFLEGGFTKDGAALKTVQLYTFKGDYVYIITGMGYAANWEKEKSDIEKAVTSFKFPQ